MFPNYLFELWIRILVLRAGGSVVISLNDPEIDTIDDVAMFAEPINDGTAIKLTTVRTGDERAGHA